LLRNPRHIGVIVGNGLTLDALCRTSNGLALWHSRDPLRWNIHAPEDPSQFLMDLHVTLGPAYRTLRATYPEEGDFALIERLLDSHEVPGNRYGTPVAQELKNYMALSFSYLQLKLLDAAFGLWYRDLPWAQWLSAHATALRIVVSYNWDLVVERLLTATGISYHRTGMWLEPKGIPLVKPHSSIDTGPVGFEGGGPGILVNNDWPQRFLAPKEMLQHRVECSLVLPGEPSPLEDLQWVKPGLDQFGTVGRELTDLLILGMSYSPPDRPGLNALIDPLPATTSIILADPSPSAEWIAHLRGLGRAVLLWSKPQDLVD
jgi:hypothetical protein